MALRGTTVAELSCPDLKEMITSLSDHFMCLPSPPRGEIWMLNFEFLILHI